MTIFTGFLICPILTDFIHKDLTSALVFGIHCEWELFAGGAWSSDAHKQGQFPRGRRLRAATLAPGLSQATGDDCTLGGIGVGWIWE